MSLSPYDEECLERAHRYIDLNISRKVEVKELCRETGFSASKLYRVWGEKHPDMPINKYLARLKMEKAVALLSKGFPCKVVAMELGYRWTSFWKIFKQYYGVAPGEFRKPLFLDGGASMYA